MSSKVLSGDASEVQQVAWRKVVPGGGLAAMSSFSPTGAGQPVVAHPRLAQTEEELSQREQRARQAGFQAGEAAAHQKAAAELEKSLARVAASLEEMLASRQQMRQRMEEDLVRLAVVVARRILHRELSVDPDALVGVIRAVLDKIEMRELHRLRLSPYDAPSLERSIAALGLPLRVELVRDPSLERGSVVLETSCGILDASIDTQLQEIDRGFADLVRRRP